MTDQPRTIGTLRILHGALVLSILIYGGIAYYLATSGSLQASMGAEQARILTIVLGALGAAELIGVFIFRGRALEAVKTKPDPMAAYFVISIISWALTEAVAIYGLVLTIVRADVTFFYPFGGASLLVMLLFAPRQEHLL